MLVKFTNVILYIYTKISYIFIANIYYNRKKIKVKIQIYRYICIENMLLGIMLIEKQKDIPKDVFKWIKQRLP